MRCRVTEGLGRSELESHHGPKWAATDKRCAYTGRWCSRQREPIVSTVQPSNVPRQPSHPRWSPGISVSTICHSLHVSKRRDGPAVDLSSRQE